jgi:hypothetical protein
MFIVFDLIALSLQYGLIASAVVGLVQAVRGLRRGGAAAGFNRAVLWFVIPWFVVRMADAYLEVILSNTYVKQGRRVSLALGAATAAILLVGAVTSRQTRPG